MLSSWSVIWAAFAFVASAAPNHYANYGQQQKTVLAAPAADQYGSYGQLKETMSDVAAPTDSSPSFDCSDKEDGAQGLGCSSSYWLCWKGVATSQECPTNLWFNMENGQCDYQANVVECGGVVTTTAAILSDNATPMPVDFDCSSVEDGQHAFMNGDICQPKFVSCVGGIAWEMACPDGLMFDPDQMLCQRIDAIIACGGTPEPITTTYSYETTLAAEPTTLEKASYGSYQTPALKVVKPLRKVEKASFGSSYQTPALKVVKPVSHVEKGSYQAPALKVVTPAIRIEKASYGSYQTPALKVVKPVSHVEKASYGSYEAPTAEETTIMADLPTTQSYGSYQAPAVKAVKPLRQVEKASYGSSYQTPASRIEKASYGSYQAPALKVVKSVSHVEKASYGSYEAPAAEETTIMADLPTTQSYGSYQAPALKVVNPAIRVEKASYGSYQAPAVKEVKPLSHVEKASYGSYQTEAPILAAEPITRRRSFDAYQTEAPIFVAEPITRERSFEAYQTEATTLRPRKTLALQTTTPLADDTTTLDYGFELGDAPETRNVFSSGYGSLDENPAADFTTRRQMDITLAADQSYGSYQAPAVKALKPASHIEKASYGSYQAPAIKVVKPLSHVEKASYGSYEAPAAEETTIMADLPTTQSYGSYQAPALKVVKPAIRVEKASYGSYQAPAIKAVKPLSHVEEASYGSYEAPAAEQTTIMADLPTTASYGSYQAPAIKAVKPLSHVEKASYGSFQAPAIKAVKPMKEQQPY